MKNKSSQEIRDIFLNFFVKNNHQLISGSSIIPQNDPTLLFINSGMAPLKNYFLGKEKAPNSRLTNIQPCIRTIDIEDIGDRHHLTFFEMMGSWSIGDYYKEKAIALAYDLLVNHFNFAKEKLYVTVYKGNPQLNIPPDEESIQFWEKVGIEKDHIVQLGEDNFWGPAGDTGPCGPCTEVFFDTGDEFGPKYHPGGFFDDKNRYIEIWNAGVFMELNKNDKGLYLQLPMKSVDTGSGIERMYLVLNNCKSIYEVDTIRPIFNLVKSALNPTLTTEAEWRILTDHMRTSTMILAEGIKPSKDGKGYVLRRLIRKSIAIAIKSHASPDILSFIANEVINQMNFIYPNLLKNKENILTDLKTEIEIFSPLIRNGIDFLNKKVANLSIRKFDDDFVFELVTTHGVPFDIITDFASNNNIKINTEGYFKKYREHQEVSRQGLNYKKSEFDVNKFNGITQTYFEGYENMKSSSKILQIFEDNEIKEEIFEGNYCNLIFDSTPLYAQSGGQVSDIGFGTNESVRIKILDVQKMQGIIIHKVFIEEGNLKIGEIIELTVDIERRKNIQRNHSATHLLHSSLRQALGNHVVQKGSLVSDDKLRFDFLHDKPLSEIELKSIELQVNEWIWANYKADITQKNYQDAINSGAMALFTENYGSKVRVVQFNNISTELCGGTHVKSTGEIGNFLIISEGSISKGIRRIEACTGRKAYELVKESQNIIKSATLFLGTTPTHILNEIKKIKTPNIKNTPSHVELISTTKFISQNTLVYNGYKLFIAEAISDFGLLQQKASEKITNDNIDIVFIVSSFENTIKTLVMVKEMANGTFSADSILKKWIIPFGGKGGGNVKIAKGGIKEKITIADLLKSVPNILKD